MTQHDVLLIRSDNPGWSSLRQALERVNSIRVIGDTSDAAHALALAARIQPELVVAAAEVEGSLSPAALFTDLRQRCRRCRIVMIVDRLEQVSTCDLLALQDLGLDGQLVWGELSTERFHRCALTILEDGYVTWSRSVADRFVTSFRQHHPAAIALAALTQRERQVLTLLAQDKSDSEIAVELNVTLSTIETHVHHLAEKLGAHTRVRLGMVAAQSGLI